MSMFCAMVILLFVSASEQSLNSDIDAQMNDTGRSLSRRKRYLLFPEGSSLQLVYDWTNHLYTAPNIFVFGCTAAMAWELPYEIVGPLKKKLDDKHRKSDNKKTKITYQPYNNYYYKTPMFQKIPAMYARPIQFNQPTRYENVQFSPSFQQNYRRKQWYRRPVYAPDRKLMYANWDRKPVMSYNHPVYNEIHRRTRRNLFSKVEKFFVALRKDGRACLLKSVCEVSQAPGEEVGTFTEEIIKAIFRIKVHRVDHENDAYDAAANASHNCTEMYPTCDFSIWNVF